MKKIISVLCLLVVFFASSAWAQTESKQKFFTVPDPSVQDTPEHRS